MRIPISRSEDQLGYFAWAFENFHLTGLLAEDVYRSGLRISLERVAAQIADRYQSELYPDYPLGNRFVDPRLDSQERYVDIIGLNRPSPSLLRPESSYSADQDENSSAALDSAAYQAMLAGFLGALNGDYFALEWLSVLMLRGPINRQVTISRFLFLSTYGRIGSREASIPTRREVLRWAVLSANQRYDIDGGLPELIRRYASAVPT